jgi:nucleoside-diphosphate kinase
MPLERTFSIIKPDATRRNLTGKINAKFEEAGLRIISQTRRHLSKAPAGVLNFASLWLRNRSFVRF